MAAESRLPPSSSVLIALASLTPPSPILSSSQLPTTLTSGDIPILFEFITEASSVDCIVHTCDKCTIADRSKTLANTGDPCGSSDKLSEYPFNTSSSLLPLYRHNLHVQKPSEVKTPRAIVTLSGPGLFDDDNEVQHNLGSDSTSFEVTTPQDSSTLNGELALPARVLPNTMTDGSKLPNSSISTFQMSIDPYTVLNPPGNLSSDLPNELCSSSQQMASNSLTRSNQNTRPWEVVTTTTFETPEIAKYKTVPSSQVDNCSQDLKPSMDSEVHFFPLSFKPNIPGHLDWLRNTTVELLIDQEGFRSVHARFKFSGYSKQTCDTRDGDEVQFRPITRQVFYFHYATFDGLPVLRRVTTNEDESRDYISRQASLNLKTNGVYTVRGSEMPIPALHDDNQRMRHESGSAMLNWRFDYLVGDRYDMFITSGRGLDGGEKILTPLTFSCSPLLLHFLQGKRVGLMHVVKKCVATKLIAEKMEPPSPPSPVLHTVTTLPSGNTHKRTKSHVLPDRKSTKRNLKNVMDFPSSEKGSLHGNAKTFYGATAIRHRRSSSAGEYRKAGNSTSFPLTSSVPQTYHPSKHIPLFSTCETFGSVRDE